MIHFQVPRRLSPDEYPSLPRLVQLVLCDDEWARIDAYRVAYEHIYGIKLGERQAEDLICQRALIQQRLLSFSVRRTSTHDPDLPSNFAVFNGLVDKGGNDYPLNTGFANLSLDRGDPARHDPALSAPASKVPVERPRMERASTSTSGVSVVVPCKKVSTPDTTKAREDSLATLISSASAPRFGPPSSPSSRIHPPNSVLGDQDREYKHWGRLDDPDSVWNKLHVERPKLDERKKFSSYTDYKKTRNQPMKDNDQLFKKRVRQSFARGEMEVLSVDGFGGSGDDDCEETERGGERVAASRAEPRRQILLVKRKGNLAGQNL